MAEDFGETVQYDEGSEEPVEKNRSNTIWIIVAVVVVVLLCCCIVTILAFVWLWNTGGDLILENFGWSLLSSIGQV